MSKKKNRARAQDKLQQIAPGIIDNKPDIISVKKALDAYSNAPANLGIGGSNLAQAGRYVMERFTWDYWTLNVLYRNNWIAKAIIDKPANEMLKNWFEIQSQIDPNKITKIQQVWTRTETKKKFLQCLKWSRLYGGCILVPMLKNQEDLSQPLDYDTIMPGDYTGCFLIDRWSGVSPSIVLVDDIESPDFGKPAYYLISDNTTGKTYNIHHSRIIKLIGRELPYWEEIAETWWGASELEHVYTELRKRDDTSANISFLIFLANIRVLKMKGLSRMLAMGDQNANQKVFEVAQSINRLMCNTGMLALGEEDGLEEHQYSFAGINDVYESFMLDISGAAEIPVDKLFGRSPQGFNSGAETLQNYYDTIQEKQETDIRIPLEKLNKIITLSAIGEIPDDMELVFNPVRRPADLEKADLAMKQSQPILEAYAGGLIDKSTALRELKQQSSVTGLWTNIEDDTINEAIKEKEEQEKEESENEKELMKEALKLGRTAKLSKNPNIGVLKEESNDEVNSENVEKVENKKSIGKSRKYFGK